MTCGSKDPKQNRKEIDRRLVEFWLSKMGRSKEQIIKTFFSQRYHRLDDEYKKFINL